MQGPASRAGVPDPVIEDGYASYALQCSACGSNRRWRSLVLSYPHLPPPMVVTAVRLVKPPPEVLLPSSPGGFGNASPNSSRQASALSDTVVASNARRASCAALEAWLKNIAKSSPETR